MRINAIFKDRRNEPVMYRNRDAIFVFKTEEELYRFIDLNGDELIASGTTEVWVNVNDGDCTIYRLERMK